MNDVLKQIDSDIKSNNVMLYMKGTPSFPQCGFSSVVVAVLDKLDVKYKAVNVLEDMAVREAIKEYSEWPTIPQLYVCGEFIGGCDIVKELYMNGELEKLLASKNILQSL